uniref:Uncharacterized protein n=2 Tax=Oryza sativa subsp. japonica TaxID=39947 RepID=Q10IQ9_ORYSJ|nr:hypothetical protein [Oryza sativa Japonica Group]ABF96930.1 hypothetical protein LOC_Os03g33380 [Oryza sativa Japonica Group]
MGIGAGRAREGVAGLGKMGETDKESTGRPGSGEFGAATAGDAELNVGGVGLDLREGESIGPRRELSAREGGGKERGRESAFHLDITAGGTFMHKTPSEGKEILDRILEITSFIEQHSEPLQKVSVSKQEEPSIAKSESNPSTPSVSAKVSSLEPSAPKNEEFQTSGCALDFRGDLHNDHENSLTDIPPDDAPIEEAMAVLLHESPESIIEQDDLHFIQKDSGKTVELQSKEPPSQPPIEPEPCPSGHQNVVLDICQETTLFLHDASLEKEKLQAMDKLETSTLEDENSTNEHENFSFKIP